MAVNGWGEIAGSITREEDGTFSGERKFWARVEHGTDSNLDVESYSQCPRRGDRYPGEPQARCVSVVVTRRTPGNRLFDVTCSYSNKFQKEESKDPLARPARIRSRSLPFRIPFIKDVKGKYLLTTAGEFIGGAESEIPGLTISVQKNLAQYPSWVQSYSRSMNSDSVRIRGLTFPKHTLKVTGIEIGDEEFENDVRFFSLGLEITFNPLTWKREFFNRGFYELVTSGKGKDKKVELNRIVLDDDEFPTEPQFLDRDGKWIRPDEKTGRVDPKKIVVLEHNDLEELPYSRLPLA